MTDAEHALHELAGIVGRIEDIERRQGRTGVIPIISPGGTSQHVKPGDIAELKAATVKLTQCVETMQGQIEWIMDRFEAWGVEE